MTENKRKSILIADDDIATIHTIFNYFKEGGLNYNLLNAPNGEIACQIAMQEYPSLIIVDWVMPGMNGIEVLKYLRRYKHTQNTPIIIATGVRTQDNYLEEALREGATDYIRKPFNRIELLARSKAAIRLADMYAKEAALMQSIIEHKNRELSSGIMQVAHKNEVLNEVKQSLEKINTKDRSLRAIVKMIQNNIDLDNHWEKIKLHFEEVHPNFFVNMQKKYKELSQNELKLCAYIKMKLSNKEIAQILNISPKGLETARYRIKKKLRLKSKDDLNCFIQNL